MPPARIDLDAALPDDEVSELAGKLLTEEYFHILVDHDVDIFKPNGEVLLKFRRQIIPKNKWRTAADSLRSAAAVTDNRGNAGGIIDEKRIGSNIGHQTKVSFRRIKRDGTISTSSRANPVKSGIVGCFDRYPRTPYCRLTAFNLEHPTKFRRAMPFIKAVDEVFARELPERHAAQMTQIKQTHPDFYLHGTSFTTITVNKNWQTAVHQDAGDYKPGFGCMASAAWLRCGADNITAAISVFPSTGWQLI